MSKTRNPDALIRIEDAIKVLCRETCHPGMLCPDNHCTEMWDEFNDVERVDAVPVVHGHWIKFGVSDKDGNHQYRCSVCECEDIHSPLVKVNYCWNCGARMDGKDGDT